jgi:(1->4)-alpha-D-glucan 1-alpha-D-glucosylmutase
VCSRDAAAGDTVELPTGRWFERFTGATYAGGSVALGSLFREFPVALLVRDA